jgi:hypothetical protein
MSILRTQFDEHRFEMVLIDFTIMVTGLGEPVLARKSELVLIDGDCTSLTSTSCPKYRFNLNFPLPCNS